jgi:hypothetical protein
VILNFDAEDNPPPEITTGQKVDEEGVSSLQEGTVVIDDETGQRLVKRGGKLVPVQ